MNHFSKVFVTVLLGMVVLLGASTVVAGTGGRYEMASLEYVYNIPYTLRPDVGYTIRATANGNADPILHVQLQTSGDFLAGNDDFSELSPQVTIPAVSTARNVWIVVRAYSASTEGTATFQIIPNPPGSTYTTTIAVNTGTVYSMASGYRAYSHFSTVEKQGGTDNTIILALSGNQETGVAYDDYDGVGHMSSVHTPACTQSCKVLVANRYASGGQTATYVWDEDVHYNDSDGDYLSNALEAALTTDSYAVDTDGDGLEDAAELMGVDTADSLLRLPYYGADAKKPDVFVQADWMECDVTDPANICGNPSDPDLYRFNAANATAVAGKYLDPSFNGQPSLQVHMHVDNGIANSNPATWYDSGAWEGATRQTTWDAGNKCDWMNPTRETYFHFARVRATGGQAPDGAHICFDASNDSDGGTFAHESGHNFNLSERASQSGTTKAWCKPNYRSVMNYAVSAGDHDFSSGEFIGVELNPSFMAEQYGLGTSDTTLLDHIGPGTKFNYAVSGQMIDWNRNGNFETGTVRAAPNWTFSSCNVGSYQANRQEWLDRSGTALAWLPTPYGDRLYWFTRRPSNGTIEFRYATSFCSLPPDEDCKTTWVPGLTSNAYGLAASATGVPAVARFWDASNSVYKLALVYRAGNGTLSYRNYAPTTGWSATVSLPGSVVIQGDPAIVTYGNQSYAYAIGSTNNTLYKWTLLTNGIWTGPTAQTWAAGGTVFAKYGIATTVGYYRLGMGYYNRIFAAIPLNNPTGKLQFAWSLDGSNMWTTLPDADWPSSSVPTTTAQPGLAYTPMNPDSSLGIGRFYVAWTPPDDGTDEVSMQMAMTEGNKSGATTEELRWLLPKADLEGDWSYGRANISLNYDLSYDRNMRAAFTTDKEVDSVLHSSLTFEAYADGLYYDTLGDQDDYPVILNNLDACFGVHADECAADADCPTGFSCETTSLTCVKD